MAKNRKNNTQPTSGRRQNSRIRPAEHEIFTAKRLIILFLVVEVLIVALMYPTFRGRWHMNKAKKLASEKKYADARKHYLWLEKNTPAGKNATFNLEMGNVSMALKKYNDAIKYYKKLITISNGQKGSYYLLGEAFLKTGNKQSAMKYFLKELKNDPSHPSCNFEIGKMYFNQGNYSRAMHHFSRIAFIPSYQKRMKPYWDTIQKKVLEK